MKPIPHGAFNPLGRKEEEGGMREVSGKRLKKYGMEQPV
jgi:hypothetical protein